MDVLVHCTLTGPRFSVYRKPSHTHSYLHYFSQHPPSQKKGVLNSLFLRAFRLSSPEYLEPELQIVTNAFKKLCYPEFFIRRVLSETKTKHLSSPPSPSPQPDTNIPGSRVITLVFPYHSDLAALNYVLKDTMYRFVFTSSNTIGRNVVTKRGVDAASSHQQSGVYAIRCQKQGCGRAYYGRSTQADSRFNDHINDYRNNNLNSALIKHVREFPGHSFAPEAAQVIWHTRNLYECKLMEAACINTFLNCNRSAAEVTVSKTYSAFLTYLARLNEGNTMQNSNDQPHMHHTPQSRHEPGHHDLGTSSESTGNLPTSVLPRSDAALNVGISSTPGGVLNVLTPNQASNASSSVDELATGSSPFNRQGAEGSIHSQRTPTRPSPLAITASGSTGTRVSRLIMEHRGSSSMQPATSRIRSSRVALSQPALLGINTSGDHTIQPPPSSQPVIANNPIYSPRNLRRHNRESAFSSGLHN